MINRRNFLRTGLAASAALATPLIGFDKQIFAQTQSEDYDLVAVKGGEPDAMFDRGIEALGGMKTFIRKGQRVVIKPNIGWDVPPERAGNTNPKLIARIIKHCYDAGAKEVSILDHTCEEWQRCYATSGIERAAKDTRAKVIPAHSERYYHEVPIPRGKILTKAKEHEAILAADVFINVPVLKSHGGARLTIAMKNLMGNIWDREFWHGNDLHQCIADFATYRKPTLNIVDAYAVMKSNGPRGISIDDVSMMKSLLLSTDIVAVDTAGAKLFGFEPQAIRYIGAAASLNVGMTALDKLSIKRISM